MAIASPEHDFGVVVQDLGTVIIELVNKASDVDAMWTDGMDVSLEDADVVDLNMTKAEVTALVVLCGDLLKFVDNVSVAAADRRKTLNDVRRIS